MNLKTLQFTHKVSCRPKFLMSTQNNSVDLNKPPKSSYNLIQIFLELNNYDQKKLLRMYNYTLDRFLEPHSNLDYSELVEIFSPTYLPII